MTLAFDDEKRQAFNQISHILDDVLSRGEDRTNYHSLTVTDRARFREWAAVVVPIYDEYFRVKRELEPLARAKLDTVIVPYFESLGDTADMARVRDELLMRESGPTNHTFVKTDYPSIFVLGKSGDPDSAKQRSTLDLHPEKSGIELALHRLQVCTSDPLSTPRFRSFGNDAEVTTMQAFVEISTREPEFHITISRWRPEGGYAFGMAQGRYRTAHHYEGVRLAYDFAHPKVWLALAEEIESGRAAEKLLRDFPQAIFNR